MPQVDRPTIVVAVLLALVVGAGVYVTYVRQPAELQRLKKAEEVARMKRAEVKELLVAYARSKEEAVQVARRWDSRYKAVPDTLTSPEVVGYLNDLTRRGFETFDISVEGTQAHKSYGYYTVRATGRGYFSHLYEFIWKVENNRAFYAVQGLTLSHIDLITQNEETGRERLQVMVAFSMDLRAYYGGPEGISGPGRAWRPVGEGDELQKRAGGQLPPVPSSVLADADPDINPFFPGIMEQVPPNTKDLLNIEKARLTSIVGGQAVFKDEQGLHQVGVGDDIYLGQVTRIDPFEGRVTAVLNRGGLIEEVERTLQTSADAYRRAMGPNELVPSSHAWGLSGRGERSASSHNR